MIPFIHLITGKQRPLTRQENLRAFRIVLFFLVGVAIAYITIALLIFGHL